MYMAVLFYIYMLLNMTNPSLYEIKLCFFLSEVSWNNYTIYILTTDTKRETQAAKTKNVDRVDQSVRGLHLIRITEIWIVIGHLLESVLLFTEERLEHTIWTFYPAIYNPKVLHNHLFFLFFFSQSHKQSHIAVSSQR